METAYRVSSLRTGDPARLGDYPLVGRLGSGGMGVVYLGRDAAGDYVAVKVVHTALATDPEYAARFRGEVRRAEQVPSFCTARFLDADLDHDPPYLVVEYVDGPSLTEVVADQGPLTGGALHSLAVGVATALAGIHGAGVIHRDLKPGNVLLPAGSTKVIDFGLAQPVEASSQLTAAHTMVGTVTYMAPERLEGKPVTPAADVFSWGCVVTYAATGHRPFEGDSPSVVMAQILTAEPDLTGVPEPLAGVVSRALARDPADRPTSQELLGMLVGGGADPARPDPVRADPVRPDRLDAPTSVRSGAGRTPAVAEDATGTAPAVARSRRRTRILVTVTAAAVAAVLMAAGVTEFVLHKTHTATPAAAMASTRPSAAAVSASPTPSATASRSASAKPSASAPVAAGGHPKPRSSASPAPAAPKPAPPSIVTTNVGRAGPISGPGGKCVDVDTNTDTSGNQVQLYDCNGVQGQQWTFTSDGKLRAFDKCLDIISEVKTPGAKVQLWDCFGSGGQGFEQRSDGSIFNPASGLCLDDPNGDTANRTQLQIWYCNGSSAQDWTVG